MTPRLQHQGVNLRNADVHSDVLEPWSTSLCTQPSVAVHSHFTPLFHQQLPYRRILQSARLSTGIPLIYRTWQFPLESIKSRRKTLGPVIHRDLIFVGLPLRKETYVSPCYYSASAGSILHTFMASINNNTILVLTPDSVLDISWYCLQSTATGTTTLVYWTTSFVSLSVARHNLSNQLCNTLVLAEWESSGRNITDNNAT